MAGFRGRRRGPALRTQRRKLVWARARVTGSFNSGAPFTPFQDDLLAGFEARYGADPVGLTLARVRGIITATHNTTTAGEHITFGIRVGAEGEVPSTEFNPMTNGEYLDWLMYEPLVAVNGTSAAEAYTSRRVDVKAKRKLEELDQTLFLYAGSSTPATGLFGITANLSMLLMLP